MAIQIRRRQLVLRFAARQPHGRSSRAQPKVQVVGFLHPGSAEPNSSLLAAFRKGLAEAGYKEGRNVAIEFRWAHGENSQLGEMAADLVQRQVAVIVTPN
jgi:putative tryptophan/tyrosine transport system substrate-binding protein